METQKLLEASRAGGLEVSAEITKYMFVSQHQNSGLDRNFLVANKFLKMWEN
jgi:hypothetical protein